MFLIERYAASVPRVDEWQATGQEILLPWKNGTLTFSALFEAHNGDHRIVATRLWEIFWYEVNGSWDPKLVMLAKTFIFAAAATIFIHLLTHALPRWRMPAAALLAVLFAFPFNFHNLMWAFQSQFDFFLLCAALGWLSLVRNRPLAALAFAGLSMFTLGGGAILAASYVPFCLWAAADGRWQWRKAAAITTGAFVLAAIGVSLRAEHAAPLASPHEQARAVVGYLAWPHSALISLVERLPETAHLFPERVRNFPSAAGSWLTQTANWLQDHPAAVTGTNLLFALILLAPTAAVVVLVLNRRIRGPAVWGALGVAGFAFLMQVATGIARAREIGIPVRYLDVVSLSLFSSLACGWVVLTRLPQSRRLLAAWAVCVVPACLVVMAGTLSTIRHRRPQVWLENVQQYFPTRDHAIFHAMIARDPEWALPFISRDIAHLTAMLDDPGYRTIVPRSVIAPEEPPGAVARLASVLGRLGLWIAAAGAGGGAWIILQSRRSHKAAVKLARELHPSVTG